MKNISNPLRVGIGGPVGSGKTALCEALSKKMRDRYEMAVITNDIYTKEDMEILLRADALPAERLMGVETGGCPHTAIREDASINLEAIARMTADFPDLDLILVESGGDNLASTFSPELSDLTIYVIDVAARARAGPVLRVQRCWSSTRSILRLTWEPASKSWRAMRSGCVASGHSYSRICILVRVSTRSLISSLNRVCWTKSRRSTPTIT